MSRIISQTMRPGGVWTEWDNGVSAMMPYKVDEYGRHYVDMDPNGDLFGPNGEITFVIPPPTP